MKTRFSVLLTAISILSLAFFLTGSACVAAPLARITVEAGEHARVDTPVSMSIASIPPWVTEEGLGLVEIRGGRRENVRTQIETGDAARLWWILSGTTRPGGKRTYELNTGPALEVGSAVSVIKNDKFVEIRKGGAGVLRYNHAIVPPPPGQSELFNRSAFIHPLWSPSGMVLTNIHPDDHIHHVGIWMPWTKTEFEGKEVDFWNLKGGQGTVRFVEFDSVAAGHVFGGFRAKQEHVALKTTSGPKVVLDETWDVRVYNLGGPDEGYWLWDFKSTQRCVADSPLKQHEYRYGGFGYRGPAEWDEDNAAYLTSEGKNRKNGHTTRARWCDMAGEVDGKWQGVTMYSHPKNFRHPEPMRIWPNGQVFFNWAPSQAGDWVMEPGQDHVFRYRIYVHEGKIDRDRTEQVWWDFAEPPAVKVEVIRPTGAVTLFDGTDFAHWQHQNGEPVKWKLDDGAMEIAPKTGSIVTKQDFGDFLLHLEFSTPQMPPNVKGQGRGNSGVYIQRRYEVQILDSYGLEPKFNECASLYRTKAPDVNVCKKPGEWQSYDIIFRAARFAGWGADAKKTENVRITIYHNGVLVHDNVELKNKTGAGRPEGPDPGPILLQDHGNKVRFRNIWIVPL